MNKSKFLLSLALILMMFIFGIAASCNFCGIPVEIKTGQGDTTGESNQSTQEETLNDEEVFEGGEPLQETNNPPKIIDIKAGEIDLEIYESEGYFDELPLDPDTPVSDIIFHIKAEDEDDDELTFRAYDDSGRNFLIEKIDNSNGELNWTTPEEIGSYILTIEVSDEKEGKDSREIEMNFIEIPEGLDLEGHESTRLDPIPEETGMIANNVDWGASGYLFVGDDDLDRYINGYISFDITDLTGEEIISASLFMGLASAQGERSHLGDLRIGSLYYGSGPFTESSVLLIRDIPAEVLVQLQNPSGDIDYSDFALADALQERIEEGSNRFQLKVYWSHPQTDEDGENDALFYRREDIYLIVQH